MPKTTDLLRSATCLLAPAIAACASHAQQPGVAETTKFSDPKLPEASGMAVSPTDPSLLWLINDSGCTAELHLEGRDGKPRGTVLVRGAKNIDWEDLAAFRWKGRPWLLVADVGDNEAGRAEVQLYLVPEPAVGGGKEPPQEVEAARTITFRYPDGPRDCESVAVDEADGSILLLSKRDGTPHLYRLPLEGPAEKAELLGLAAEPPVPEGSPFHPFGRQPTAMDLSPDGKTAAVLTYLGVFAIRRGPGESWPQAFARPWETIGSFRLFQAESVCFSADGESLLITSEGVGAPLLSFPLK
ncbi:hypothetical protein [Haloferula sargassicola]|uniref:Integral membrane protein n=1 Tax=Haloferula sargassicola TaxID=490096 RepID=A0ABP9UQ58_9BACT